MISVLKRKLTYKIRKTCPFNPVAPRLISGIHILIVQFMYRTLKY